MKAKLLFIGGCGRSGSTLLSVFLNAHPGIVSVGELKFLPEWIARDAPCTCGEPVSVCPFWQDIAGDLAQRIPSDPAVIAGGEFRLDHGDVAKVLRAVGERTRCEVIVDSSKTVADLERLKEIEEIELYVIHLIRDGRGYLRSRTRPISRNTVRPEVREPVSAIKAIGRWVGTNLRFSRQARQLPKDRLIRVRYEDFVEHPEFELARICNFVGLPLHRSMLDDGMRGCHDIGGNGWRYGQSSSIRLKPDRSWQHELTRVQKLLFAIGGSWLNRRYGY